MEFKNKILRFFTISLFMLCMIPLNSYAQLMITTEIATGEIAGIQNNVIELEDGTIFHPAREGEELNFQPGDMVTIEFYTNPEEEIFYLNIAPGENTLSATPTPEKESRQPVY